ncbi:hypothetical protein ACFO3I_12470 [Rheinheimera marina]|uniref:Uncharacterized protein n=1 Tax=Rheinheimera marina TaxID=1774958 RepID=A0ABV9JNJ5_9GAMM
MAEQTQAADQSESWRLHPPANAQYPRPPADEPDEAEAIVELGYN